MLAFYVLGVTGTPVFSALHRKQEKAGRHVFFKQWLPA
jgi:hypothetical protein